MYIICAQIWESCCAGDVTSCHISKQRNETKRKRQIKPKTKKCAMIVTYTKLQMVRKCIKFAEFFPQSPILLKYGCLWFCHCDVHELMYCMYSACKANIWIRWIYRIYIVCVLDFPFFSLSLSPIAFICFLVSVLFDVPTRTAAISPVQ